MKPTLIKYIIALLSTQPNLYTDEAYRLFSSNSEGYLIGPNSHPHITLCQFYADQETIKQIQNEIKETTYFPRIHFTGISFIKDLKPNIWWAELSIAREPDLIDFQEKFVSLLKKHNISCLNDIGEKYRPHLTLARIRNLTLSSFDENKLNESSFVLALGKADELGQFIEIINVIQ